MCIFVEDEGYRFPAKAGPAASCRCVVVVASAVPMKSAGLWRDALAKLSGIRWFMQGTEDVGEWAMGTWYNMV